MMPGKIETLKALQIFQELGMARIDIQLGL
jgi:hypothetical protein